jgi:hypothetical protein
MVRWMRGWTSIDPMNKYGIDVMMDPFFSFMSRIDGSFVYYHPYASE